MEAFILLDTMWYLFLFLSKFGQLCASTSSDFTIPGIIQGNYKEMKSGGSHTILLGEDGILYSCGYNNVYFLF
jgi:alpha-tubulin suppressor-like RCC1 family protein